jgi:acetoacetyl-CoA synthetase
MTEEGALCWVPREDFARDSRMADYMRWVNMRHGSEFRTYDELRSWSVSDLSVFWESIWQYFEIQTAHPYSTVLRGSMEPGCVWFEGAAVNYAEHILRATAERMDLPAVHFVSERQETVSVTWSELSNRVMQCATMLRRLGVKPGDRVASYMPNNLETLVAFLGAASIGAIWAAASPEFGVSAVVDRFQQIAPKVLFVCDGYRFAGREISRSTENVALTGALASTQHVIGVAVLADEWSDAAAPGALSFAKLMAAETTAPEDFVFEYVAHDHPLWILFSSGTTGLPKAIAQSHVGILVEHHKLMALHMNLSPEKVAFLYSTTGWMMWNLAVSCMLTGTTIVLYDGSPTYPDQTRLWKICEETKATYFGAGAAYLQSMAQSDVIPKERFALQIDSCLIGGSTVGPELFDWFYQNVSEDCWFSSQSGGTETCTCLVTAVPTLPVYAGEIQARGLGIDLHAWNESGKSIIGEVGELVMLKPFPSMPLYLWGDDGNRRYNDAYFTEFPGVWRHGDLIKINERGGCYVYGRSDSTLNRHGVRIGTAEIYELLQGVEGVADALIVCLSFPEGSFFMPLFVKLEASHQLDTVLVEQIRSKLREEGSPRHLPDAIFDVPEMPYTLTGKKMEVPVRKLLDGEAIEKVANPGAMANPGALMHFAQFGGLLQQILTELRESNSSIAPDTILGAGQLAKLQDKLSHLNELENS